ncbi:unnamed protein product [Diabrotica balteata]|uniref:Uncharacterized protein n=1 Tax=Diabrotica balteata TaxID=107213 RepID=A0A9N9XBW5_DIABA|nr:unnamed protein product [Diabrotica balteata]
MEPWQTTPPSQSIRHSPQPGPSNRSPSSHLPSQNIRHSPQPEMSNILPFHDLPYQNDKPTKFEFTSPQPILPKTTKKQRQTRNRGKTAILTESPYKNELMESTQIKEARNSNAESKKRKVFKNDGDKKKTKQKR